MFTLHSAWQWRLDGREDVWKIKQKLQPKDRFPVPGAHCIPARRSQTDNPAEHKAESGRTQITCTLNAHLSKGSHQQSAKWFFTFVIALDFILGCARWHRPLVHTTPYAYRAVATEMQYRPERRTASVCGCMCRNRMHILLHFIIHSRASALGFGKPKYIGRL